MITAVDTNVFLDVLRPNPSFVDSSLRLLEVHADRGSLIVCDVVYSELAAHFAEQRRLDDFLEDFMVRVDPMDHQARFDAGRAWLAYRRAGGKRERILSDFIIGAHARQQAARLLTRDRGFYQTYFPELEIVAH